MLLSYPDCPACLRALRRGARRRSPVVALGARNIPGLKVIVNISGGLRTPGCSDAQNGERLVAAARHYSTRSRVPNLWYYAETDQYAPGPTVAEMRSGFLEGGGYAKLTHYGKITDSTTGKEIDGHQLWSKQRVQIMVDIDNDLRSNGLPTRDINEAKRLAEKIKASANSLEERGSRSPQQLDFAKP